MAMYTGFTTDSGAFSGSQRCGPLVELGSVIHELGANLDILLMHRSFDRSALSSSEQWLSFATVSSLLEDCAEATDCKHLGVLLGTRASSSDLGLFGAYMQAAPTLAHAVHDFATNMHFYALCGASSIIIDRNHVAVSVRPYPDTGAVQYPLATMSYAAKVLSEIFGCWPTQFHFPGSRYDIDAGGLELLLKPATLCFNRQDYGIRYSIAALSTPNPVEDPERRKALARALVRSSEHSPHLVQMVRRQLMSSISSAACHQRPICEILNIHPRTLNRRLRDHDTSLRSLTNQVRFEIACELLVTSDASATAVSQILNYSEPSAFCRAFREWSGMSPNEWRCHATNCE